MDMMHSADPLVLKQAAQRSCVSQIVADCPDQKTKQRNGSQISAGSAVWAMAKWHPHHVTSVSRLMVGCPAITLGQTIKESENASRRNVKQSKQLERLSKIKQLIELFDPSRPGA
jgi:hypothetical protein